MKLLCHFLSYLRGEPNCDRNEPKFSATQQIKSTESTFNFFLFATTPKKPKKDLGLPFFLLFAPTLIPEAFQIKTVCSKKNHYQSLKKRKSWVSMIKITKYFLLISHTLERNNKPSHSNQFYCKKNYYCIEKKIKILPFLQWIVIKCAKPLHPKSLLCPPNVFCSSKKLLQHSVGCPLFSIIHEITVLRQLTISIFG